MKDLSISFLYLTLFSLLLYFSFLSLFSLPSFFPRLSSLILLSLFSPLFSPACLVRFGGTAVQFNEFSVASPVISDQLPCLANSKSSISDSATEKRRNEKTKTVERVLESSTVGSREKLLIILQPAFAFLQALSAATNSNEIKETRMQEYRTFGKQISLFFELSSTLLFSSEELLKLVPTARQLKSRVMIASFSLLLSERI